VISEDGFISERLYRGLFVCLFVSSGYRAEAKVETPVDERKGAECNI
jgi:hypothetical protein